MNGFLKGTLVGILLVCLYLLFWPIPIAPQSWEAPESLGFEGDFTPNSELARLDFLSIGDRHGPEDVAAYITENGLRLYVSSQDGDIIEIDPSSNTHRLFAKTGGVPLGIEFDRAGHLWVADAHKGLLSISPAGEVKLRTNDANNVPILYADDVDIAPNGIVYFSDASTKFGAKAAGSTLQGSVLEIFEHGRTGRILAYDPTASQTYEILSGLSFPNGIAAEPSGQSILYNETGEYRVMRLFVDGPRLGQTDILIENLPGFPDNINPGPPLLDGTPTYFIGLVSPRNKLIDRVSDKVFLRKILWRLPDFMKPKPEIYSHLIHIDGQGRVISSWQDPNGRYPLVTGAIVVDEQIYLSSLTAPHLGYRAFSD